MARYFFDVRNDGALAVDEVGLELDDLTAAVGEAARALAERTEEMVEGSLRQELVVEIRSAIGPTMLRVTLTLDHPVGPLAPINILQS
jgi:hypothetical protein